MPPGIQKSAIALALIGLTTFAVPAAAQASTIYPPRDACSVTPTTTSPGSRIVFSCAADTFGTEENIKITVTGENGGNATFGFVRFAVSTGSFDATSSADGALGDVSITLPSDASGIYNIAAVSPSSAGGTASVTVTASGEESLPSTGGDASALGLWAGAGLLVVAGGAVAIAASVRRSRSNR
ncbi:LPXTG cell wall anchor domain-containing protein [uncultured Microbacterium sp.]|uniref:LPXTG cell wall anchor domain-containing protein n=1 Tax=uncultured Microbacterium sp. TaxID=191216 RepID=UPI002630081D|nr:LPXTG cell wall anchor domain-containing protein [uncultured Microbacterium sp.]